MRDDARADTTGGGATAARAETAAGADTAAASADADADASASASADAVVDANARSSADAVAAFRPEAGSNADSGVDAGANSGDDAEADTVAHADADADADAEAEALATALDEVGPRLRALRNRRGLTLAELSTRTGISVSTLSRLESGARRPTLELLMRIAAVHRASLDDLVGAPQLADPRIRPRPFYRDGKAIIPLTRETPGLHAYKMVLPGHPPDAPVPQRAHEGYDWLYVLSGRVRLALGDDELVLGPGEAAEFDTRVPHGTASASLEAAEVLNLLSAQGERVHLRTDGE
jgi:transcriptional regulator with XRE-family HTH domain